MLYSKDTLYQKIFYSDGTFDKREGFREDDAFLNSYVSDNIDGEFVG